MVYLHLFLSILLPIGLCVGFFLLEKKTKFNSLKDKYKLVIYGVSFGVISIACTECGYYSNNGLISIANTAPLLASFLFSGPSGIIAGGIAFTERLIASLCSGRESLTVCACSIDLIFAGVYGFLLKKFMFENKRPSWGFAIACTLVLEVLSLTLVFLTNITSPTDSMNLIKETIAAVLVSSILAVVIPTIIYQVDNYKKIGKNTIKRKMSTQVQWWLLGSIIVCYLLSSLVIFGVQTNSAYQSADTTFKLTINDVSDDVNTSSKEYLSPILDDVINRYNNDPYDPNDIPGSAQKLHDLMSGIDGAYQLASVDLISLTTNGGRGDFLCSSDITWGEKCGYNYDFYMTQFPGQSYELHTKMQEYGTLPYESFIQEFGKRSDDTRGTYYLKYAAKRISNDKYIAISIDADVFYTFVNSKIAEITSFRHVNNTGHIIIMQYDGSVVSSQSDPRFKGKVLEQKIKELSDTSLVFTRQRGTIYQEDAFYMYNFAETYKIVVVLPYQEVLSARDTSFILFTFMEIIIFAILYALIYFLLKRKVVSKIETINTSLGKIIDGDLYVKVDVDSSYEFASLSKDINSTVDRLKLYIEEAEKRIDDELAFAKTIQLNSLPPSKPNYQDITQFDLCAKMFTAKEVGGDFYDYYPIDKNTIAFLVADVSGKGIPAAMFMMESKAILKNLARSRLSVDKIMSKVNQVLASNNSTNMFITCWFGILDLQTGKVDFINAGHTRPLICHSDGKWEYVEQKANMVLAAFDTSKYDVQHLTLEKGDRLYLYTDGVTEATREDGALYGEARLCSYLNSEKDVSLEKTLNGIKKNIDDFVEGADQFDDITMLVIKYLG